MDDDDGLGLRDWGCYYEPPPTRSNLGLQLMSSVEADRDTKNLLSSGMFLHREYNMQPPLFSPMEYARDSWAHQTDIKYTHVFPVNQPSYPVSSDVPMPHALQMIQQPDPPKDVKPLQVAEPVGKKKSSKKKSQGQTPKIPKEKKPKKPPAPKGDSSNRPPPKGRSAPRSMEIVINGMDFDISGLPTPVCTCTGMPQQCYRWGVGGWQSACCTTNISTYPLPMSTKRKGARIPGRKMSQGTFKKVLEKLISEGQNLSNPIDLKHYWAKHGTNKFVTIR